MAAYGIDLGTTYSCIAKLDGVPYDLRQKALSYLDDDLLMVFNEYS